MRIVRYYIINKQTKQAVYTDCRKNRVEEILAGMTDKENYTIGYKWLSL